MREMVKIKEAAEVLLHHHCAAAVKATSERTSLELDLAHMGRQRLRRIISKAFETARAAKSEQEQNENVAQNAENVAQPDQGQT